jgi:hypothetical protein
LKLVYTPKLFLLHCLAIGTLFWTVSIVRGVFDIHDVSGVDSTPVFRWFVVIILTLFLHY